MGGRVNMLDQLVHVKDFEFFGRYSKFKLHIYNPVGFDPEKLESHSNDYICVFISHADHIGFIDSFVCVFDESPTGLLSLATKHLEKLDWK